MTSRPFDKHPLIAYLRKPEASLSFSPADWEQLLRAARLASLSSRVAWLAKQSGLMARLPEKIQFHLNSAIRVADSQALSVRWEVAQIQKALSEAGVALVLLKGAAYIMGQFAAAPGRLLSDIDIMVPKSRLADGERALYGGGWFSTKLDAYDQRYYRKWMHELPPMQHLGRGSTLDVHHTILPPTAKLKPDVSKLWEAASAIKGEPGVLVLSPTDLVLHSATHLFHDGEFDHGLRDLVDIEALLREFGEKEGFWPALVPRAIELDLVRPLFYALRYCAKILTIPVPEAVMRAAADASGAPASGAFLTWMDTLFLAAILPNDAKATNVWVPIAQFLLYLRGHWLRMPLGLLLLHLGRKMLMPKSTEQKPM